MNWIGWVAIIGAAAWVPQIILFLYKLLAKPKLKFIPQSTIEVGYSSYGPILNPSFAISSSRKDALVEKIELEVIHESGAKRKFTWQLLDEQPFETTSTSGEITTLRKTQPAVALKISMLGLVEKKIGFQDNSFIEKRKAIYGKLVEKEEYLRKVKPQTYLEALFEEKEYIDVSEFIKNEFYWKKGDYDILLYVYESSLKKPHIEYFTFTLSQTHADILERNIEVTKNSTRDNYLIRAKKIPSLPYYNWAWVYPAINRKK